MRKQNASSIPGEHSTCQQRNRTTARGGRRTCCQQQQQQQPPPPPWQWRWWSSLSKKCSSSRELSRYFRICSPAWPYHDFQEAHRRTELSCHRQRQWETAWATTFWMHAGGQKSLQKDLDVWHDDFTAVRPAASMKDVKCARPNLLVCLRLARPPRDVSAT